MITAIIIVVNAVSPELEAFLAVAACSGLLSLIMCEGDGTELHQELAHLQVQQMAGDPEQELQAACLAAGSAPGHVLVLLPAAASQAAQAAQAAQRLGMQRAVVLEGGREGAGSMPGCCRFSTHTALLQHISLQRLPQPPLPHPLVVGYLMKASRQRQLALAGLLPLGPVDGVCFMPLDIQQPLEQQPAVDILLHKASDELRPGPAGQPVFSPRLLAAQAWLQRRPDICVVDPFESVTAVLDRGRMCQKLEALAALQLGVPGTGAGTGAGAMQSRSGAQGAARARGPGFLLVDSFTNPGLPQEVATSGLRPPYIAKPAVACGLHDSHQMALVLSDAAVPRLRLPCPAVLQEYYNHSATEHKVYVLGEQVFVTSRPSIPNLDIPRCSSALCQVLHFDSLNAKLAQLPLELQQQGGEAAAGAAAVGAAVAAQALQPAPPLEQLQQVAAYLRSTLGLSLFGFDVIVDCSSGDLVVIDVNYFPNYRGVKEAPTLLRSWLRTRKEQQLKQGRLTSS